MPQNLSLYSLSRVLKLIKPISDEINKKLYRPFPRPLNSLLSKYEYYQHFVTISKQGYYSNSRLLTTLFDWSFIRSLVANKYSVFGPPCYDPCSLFLLDLFRVIDEFPSTAKFRNTLADLDEGKPYRTYAGITTHIPCEATFSNFRTRLGHETYDAIHSVLVEIAYELHLITGRIISYDGCLFPSHARFKGCTYADKSCSEIRVNGDFIQKTHYRILNMLQNLDTLTPGKEHRSFSHCLSSNFPDDVKPPRIEVVSWSLVPFEQESHDTSTEKLLGIEEQLKLSNLMLKPIRSNISKISQDLIENPVYVKCPRAPHDLDAKNGHRRSKIDQDEIEYVFGYNLVTPTSVEPELGLELPISSFVGNGFLHEGSALIPLKSTILTRHPYLKTTIDIADAAYDDTENYNRIRSSGSIPFIDYNNRNENLSSQSILKRGYDHNGWPIAPCNYPATPDGYEKERQRLLFACLKKCLSNPNDIPLKGFISACPYRNSPLGFTKHLYINQSPRLLNEVPRGTKRYKLVRNLRSSSERTNSSLKDGLGILDNPVVTNITRASIVAAMGNIAVFTKRIMDFIVHINQIKTKMHKAKSSKASCEYRTKLHPKTVPKSLANLIAPHPVFGDCSSS